MKNPKLQADVNLYIATEVGGLAWIYTSRDVPCIPYLFVFHLKCLSANPTGASPNGNKSLPGGSPH